MPQLIQSGSYYNIPVEQYYVESEEDIKKIEGAPIGSVVMILTKEGLKIKMLHSSGEWIEI